MSLEAKQMAAMIAVLVQQNERLIEECERLQRKWEDLYDDTAEIIGDYRKRIDLLQRTRP